MIITSRVLESSKAHGEDGLCSRGLAMMHQYICVQRASKPSDAQGAVQVFREPVITPSGLSYEHSALQEHLSKVRNKL